MNREYKLTQEEVDIINEYEGKTYKPEDLFAFVIELGSNMDTSGFVVFGADALKDMNRLAVCRKGIVESPNIKPAKCRILKTGFVTADNGEAPVLGGPVIVAVAFCYMPITEDTKDIVSIIRNKHLMTISTGCSTPSEHRRCSICGETGDCIHKPGETYDGKTCYKILTKIDEFYEYNVKCVPTSGELTFTTINVDGVCREWEFDIEDLRNEFYEEECCLPGGDDPVTSMEFHGIPMYVNTFDDIVELFGINNVFAALEAMNESDNESNNTLQFTTFNINGNSREWVFNSIEDLRDECHKENPDLPSCDDSIIRMKFFDKRMYVGDIEELIQLFGLNND